MSNQTQLAKNKAGAGMYLPDNKSDAYKLAASFSKSGFCPAAYRNKPDDVYLAMAYGAQIGLNPLLAVQNIAVVNGKPAVYGDALTAIAQGHKETEEYEDGYTETGAAFCKIVRKGRTIYREFSEEDAKRAGLWGRNTWAQYPKRMLLWRARGWAVRDAYADVLMGLWSVEEASDAPKEPIDVTPPATQYTSKGEAIKNRLIEKKLAELGYEDFEEDDEAEPSLVDEDEDIENGYLDDTEAQGE